MNSHVWWDDKNCDNEYKVVKIYRFMEFWAL